MLADKCILRPSKKVVEQAETVLSLTTIWKSADIFGTALLSKWLALSKSWVQIQAVPMQPLYKYSSFLPQFKDMYGRLDIDSKLAVGVNASISISLWQPCDWCVTNPGLGRSEPAFFHADSNVATHTDNWLYLGTRGYLQVKSIEPVEGCQTNQWLTGPTCIFKRLKNIHWGAAAL